MSLGRKVFLSVLGVHVLALLGLLCGGACSKNVSVSANNTITAIAPASALPIQTKQKENASKPEPVSSKPKTVSYEAFAKKQPHLAGQKQAAIKPNAVPEPVSISKPKVDFTELGTSIKEAFSKSANAISVQAIGAETIPVSYCQALKACIDAAWEQPSNATKETKPVQVAFTIGTHGRLTSFALSKPSNDPEMNASVKSAFARVRQFPVPPHGKACQFSLVFNCL